MRNWSLNLQIKSNVVHKIRPGIWFRSPHPGGFRNFQTKEEFLSAVEEAVYQNLKTHSEAGTWKACFLKAYKQHDEELLEIPRWHEIAGQFGY